MSFQNAKVVKIGGNPEDYHQNSSDRGKPEYRMGSSSLRAFWGCPSKWREPIVAEDGTVSYHEFPGSKSTEWGDLFDCLLLTPEQFEARYQVKPAMYPCEPTKKDPVTEKPWNANSTWCKEWVAACEAAGKQPVSQSLLYQVNQAIQRFRRDPILGEYVAQSDKQVWLEADWHDAETGLVVPCKCLIDLVPRLDSRFHKGLGDVKTTKNARLLPWEKWAHFVGYEVQAAWYVDIYQAAFPEREITDFCFLLSENTPPYEVGRRFMSQDLIDPRGDMGDIASGRRQYRQMIADYCRCLKSGFWPGYDDTDEATDTGFSIVKPNPYAEQARQFAPRYVSADEAPEEEEMEAGELTP